MDVETSIREIERCRYPTGLYSAVAPDSAVMIPLYRNMWIRDTIYTLLAYEAMGDIDRLREGVHALIDRVLLRWAPRIDWRIVHGVPQHDVEYLAGRGLDPSTHGGPKSAVDDGWELRRKVQNPHGMCPGISLTR